MISSRFVIPDQLHTSTSNNNTIADIPLPRSFYQRNTAMVAQELIGCFVIRVWNNQILVGIISETEAYGGHDDPASHAYTKKTARNAAMFGPDGHSYLYFIYGNHYCLNIVAKEKKASAGGVLIRSLIPLQGKNIMQQLRGNKRESQLTNGPGKICQALQLTCENNHHDITQYGELYIIRGIYIDKKDIIQTPRIGISKAQDRLWRFIKKM